MTKRSTRRRVEVAVAPPRRDGLRAPALRACVALVAAWLLWGGAAIAQQLPGEVSPQAAGTPAPTPPPAPAAKPAPAIRDVPLAAPAQTPPPAADDFNFSLLPEEHKVSLADQLKLERQVQTRRSLLQWHQALGLATAALMVATVITGQLNFSDRFGGGNGTGQYELWHDGFTTATTLTFASAGLLALLAPTPYEKKSSGIDTITIHKYSMLIATLGMVSEVPLGIITASREGYTDQATIALVHLVIGYITAGALGVGTAALFF